MRSVEKRGKRIVDTNARMLIPWLLICAYAYEVGDPLVSDATYDEWARRLWRVFWRVKHRHKNLITRGETTCRIMLSSTQYPGMVIGAYHELAQLRRANEHHRKRRRA